MSVKFARPRVSDLTFQVFGRSVHPELLSIFAERSFLHDNYTATVSICEAGHAISLRMDDDTVTEIAATRDQPLPEIGKSFTRRLRGSRHQSAQFSDSLQYEVSFHVEHLAPEEFLNFHQELMVDSERVELSFRFPPGTRFSPDPLSLIRVDAQSDSLLIHAYHTFPDDCAVVKSQSLFQLL